MTYGAKTLIAPGALERFYLFQLPLHGSASVTNGGNRHEIGGGFSGVLNPDAPTCMIWSEGCVQLLVQVEKEALNAVARAEFGLPFGHVLRFDGANDLRGAKGRALLGVLDCVMREAEAGAPVERSRHKEARVGRMCFMEWGSGMDASPERDRHYRLNFAWSFLISGLMEPTRTLSPAMLKMRCSCTTLAR